MKYINLYKRYLFKEVFNYLELGDAVIFHKDCIHKSNHNFSNLTISVVIHIMKTAFNIEFKEQTPDEL